MSQSLSDVSGTSVKRPAATKNARKDSSSTKTPTWSFWVIGILCAIVAALSAHIFLNQPHRITGSGHSSSVSQKDTSTLSSRLKFDFYDILKQQRVEVSATTQESVPAADAITYFLQVGSFRSQNDAESLRAELILQNLDATIERADAADTIWYRVIVGPFDSRPRLAKARSLLASNNISPLLLKR